MTSPGYEVSMQVPFLNLVQQYRTIEAEVNDAIQDVLSRAAFIGGAAVRDFEENFQGVAGSEHVVGVANGTDAIEIALDGILREQRGEVIVPANSFIATSEAVSRSGHQVVFADTDPNTYVLDPADVRKRVGPQTLAIIAVHLYGQPAPMAELRRICDEFGLALIEDAAQAHGARVCGKPVGSIGDAATFSFYPGKNLGAYGDAGAITTNDAALAKLFRMLANHGRMAKYDHVMEGRNSRLDALQARILNVKLPHLEGWTERRIELASRYRDQLTTLDELILPVQVPGTRHVYHLFVVRSERRDQLREWLGGHGIETGIHYPIALPRLQAYSRHPQHSAPFVAAEHTSTLLSLPIGETMSDADVDTVCAAIRMFYAA
jgi:dTDP-4-amino-4,6-dideoxygalactose transaminase